MSAEKGGTEENSSAKRCRSVSRCPSGDDQVAEANRLVLAVKR